MSGRYPLLDQSQVEKILKRLNFEPKPQKGSSHTQWVGYTKKQRRIVTVDRLKKGKKEKYSHELLKKMIDQSGLTKKEFYSYL